MQNLKPIHSPGRNWAKRESTTHHPRPTTHHISPTNFTTLNILRPTNFFFTHDPPPTTHYPPHCLEGGRSGLPIPTRFTATKKTLFFRPCSHSLGEKQIRFGELFRDSSKKKQVPSFSAKDRLISVDDLARLRSPKKQIL